MGRRLTARDLPGWGVDPDLIGIQPHWRVTLEMRPIDESMDDDDVFDPAMARRYARIYAKHGPWALPPLVYVGIDRITGTHRMYGAALAGLTELPALVVHLPAHAIRVMEEG